LDPSQWWDHRSGKTNERYPDFKHKKTGEALLLDDRQNLPWVAAEMAAMAPGIVQLNPSAWNQKLTKYVKDGQLEKAIQLFQQQEGMTPDKFTFVQARAEGTGNILTHATRACETKLCHFSGGAEFMCQYRCP